MSFLSFLSVCDHMTRALRIVIEPLTVLALIEEDTLVFGCTSEAVVVNLYSWYKHVKVYTPDSALL